VLALLARLRAQRHFEAIHKTPLPALALDAWSVVSMNTGQRQYVLTHWREPVALFIIDGEGLAHARWYEPPVGQPARAGATHAIYGNAGLVDLIARCILAHEGAVTLTAVPSLLPNATVASDYAPTDIDALARLQCKLGASLLATYVKCQQTVLARLAVTNPWMALSRRGRMDPTSILSSELMRSPSLFSLMGSGPYANGLPPERPTELFDQEQDTATEQSADAPPADDTKLRAETLDAALAELDALVGLTEVKTQVRQLVNLLRISRRRSDLGMPATVPSLHAALLGNAGTGKTTVARILGRIFYGLGLLESDVFVEVTRGDLVGEYVGQSASKTRAKIKEAMGGVLFIDEAYSLDGGGGKDYGGEVLAEIVAAMENHRGKIAVIVAGYTKELIAMIETNPGLKSRIAHRLKFADYGVQELSEIFTGMLGEDYELGDGAQNAVMDTASAMLAAKDKHFGNGREMRTLFERAVMHQADRLATGDIDQLDEATLRAFAPEDITPPDALTSKRQLGFAA
jgi:SpoVK/Ycf46/Vps4 family AAA+-type ATPase